MSLLELRPPQVTAADDANRIRAMLTQVVINTERSLQQVARITQLRGRKEIDTALGADAAQLPVVYGELSRCVAALKPGIKIPELPG